MEPIIFDRSPLAEYLKDEAHLHSSEWPQAGSSLRESAAAAAASSPPPSSSASTSSSESDHGDGAFSSANRNSLLISTATAASSRTPSRRSSLSPRPPSFAPMGRPMVRSRFRNSTPTRLWVDIPPPSSSAEPAAGAAVGAGTETGESDKKSKRRSLQEFKTRCSAAVASTITSADNARFLERFRYTIVASQLLSGHAIPGQQQHLPPAATVVGADSAAAAATAPAGPPTTEGLVKWLSAIWVVTVAAHLVVNMKLTWRQNGVLLLFLATCAGLAVVSLRKRWLQHQKDSALAAVSEFVTLSHELDSVISATVALVQEVELVSRGYRLSTPLPPISRIEDRSQARKCVRLRKALRTCYGDVLKTYGQATAAIKASSEPQDLEKYYDIYDLSDFDVTDALSGFSETEFEDPESLRALKILGARFTALRKVLLCSLLATDAAGDGKDVLAWTTAAEAIAALNRATAAAFERLRSILSEEESFPAPPTPKAPLTPSKERWRAQLRKLGSLSSGIRGLQAKMHILREESDRVLEDSAELSDVGPTLMTQYESIGNDLKELVRAWEDGKAALASGIDRNEKRLSSMSTIFSPTASSWSGLSTVEEGGGADEALRALTGESPPTSENENDGDGDETEEMVYEAVAIPRGRAPVSLSREQRIVKMKEEREQREQAREAAEASRDMIRELGTVIRPRMSGGEGRYAQPKRSSRVSM